MIIALINVGAKGQSHIMLPLSNHVVTQTAPIESCGQPRPLPPLVVTAFTLLCSS